MKATDRLSFTVQGLVRKNPVDDVVGKSSLFTPLEHTEGPLRNEFSQKVPGKDISQVKAGWSKLVLTGKGTAPKEYGSSAEVRKAVAADVNAIGYIDKAAVDDSVKVILSVQ